MVLRPKGMASRTSSGSSSEAKLEPPLASAFPSEFTAIDRREQPGRATADTVNSTASRVGLSRFILLLALPIVAPVRARSRRHLRPGPKGPVDPGRTRPRPRRGSGADGAFPARGRPSPLGPQEDPLVGKEMGAGVDQAGKELFPIALPEEGKNVGGEAKLIVGKERALHPLHDLFARLQP